MRATVWLAVLLAFASSASANFADTQGFSGKHGATCGACHTLMPGDPSPPAVVVLNGLPEAWKAGRTYNLSVHVSGGPASNPLPNSPQAGFDLETDAGAFAVPATMRDLLRMPNTQEITYTGQGTLVRSWDVAWIAPDLSDPPEPATFWVAAVAANGNHVMGGPDAAGERGDRVTHEVYVVPASEDALRDWQDREIPRPSLAAPIGIRAGDAPILEGSAEAWVDAVEWSLDGAPEWTRAVGTATFFVALPPLAPGAHVVAARAVVDERRSEATTIHFAAEGDPASAAEAGRATMAPAWGLLILAIPLAPFAVILWRKRM